MRASGRRFDGGWGISVRWLRREAEPPESESNGSMPARQLVEDHADGRRDRCAGRAGRRAPAPADMYSGVPHTKPARVRAGPSSPLPSMIFANTEVEHLDEVGLAPALLHHDVLGALRSRWMTPALWRVGERGEHLAHDAHECAPRESATSRERMWWRSLPLTNSIGHVQARRLRPDRSR